MQETLVLFGRSLSPTEEHHHEHIVPQPLGVLCRCAPSGDDALHQQHLAGSTHRLPAVPQNGRRARIVPVVNDPLQEVGVSALGD